MEQADTQHPLSPRRRARARPKPLAMRFWRKVNKAGPEARAGLGPCWLWTGAVGSDGYGVIRDVNEKFVRAHIASYELTHGLPVPTGQVLLHACDTPLCVNPGHLTAGSQLENIADMVAKNRQARGTAIASAKLTQSDVDEIRRWWAPGKHGVTKALAERFGVSEMQIRRIGKGQSWKDAAG